VVDGCSAGVAKEAGSQRAAGRGRPQAPRPHHYMGGCWLRPDSLGKKFSANPFLASAIPNPDLSALSQSDSVTQLLERCYSAVRGAQNTQTQSGLYRQWSRCYENRTILQIACGRVRGRWKPGSIRAPGPRSRGLGQRAALSISHRGRGAKGVHSRSRDAEAGGLGLPDGPPNLG
jgi:hypothetical protein